MIVLRKTLKVTPEDYFRKHLQIINVFMPVQLTGREIDVLAAFMYYDNFKADTKQRICDMLNISSAGMGNYMATLKKKGYIIKDEKDNYTIIPVIRPASTAIQMYDFTLKI